MINKLENLTCNLLDLVYKNGLILFALFIGYSVYKAIH